MTTAPASSAGVAASIRPREAAPRRWPDRPTRCRHRATPPGQADLDRQVGRADVDAQLQARAGDHGLQPALLEQRFHLAPAAGVERRVVRGDGGLGRVSGRLRAGDGCRRFGSCLRSWVIFSVSGRVLAKTTVVRLAFITWRSRRSSRR